MINELFKQPSQSIFTFKKGDIIIRTEAAMITETIYNQNLGIETEVSKKYSDSFRDTPVEFIAIENNVIYIRELKIEPGWDKKRIFKLLTDYYQDGWQLFKVPEGLTLEECL